MEGSRAENIVSEWEQHSDCIAENEAAGVYKNVRDRHNGPSNGEGGSIGDEFWTMEEGEGLHGGEDEKQVECNDKYPAHHCKGGHYNLVQLPEVYKATQEEKEDGLEDECWEERNDNGNVQPLEYHESHVPLTSAIEAANRVCATVVLREQPFKGHGIGARTDTGCEADPPKAIHRNRKDSGFLGDGRVGYVRQIWVTTVQ